MQQPRSMLSNRWHVQLGEGGRRMTDSQVVAATARCWIDEHTPVRKPGSADWTKLADVMPAAPRITKERVVGDVDTSAMIVLSGEIEIVSDTALNDEEIAAASPPSLKPKLFVLSLLLLAGAGFAATRYVPNLDTRLRSVISDARPAPAVVPPSATVTAAVRVAPPKMIRPVPKMREPSPPPPPLASDAPLAGKTHAKPNANAKAKSKAKRRNGRH